MLLVYPFWNIKKVHSNTGSEWFVRLRWFNTTIIVSFGNMTAGSRQVNRHGLSTSAQETVMLLL